MRHRSMLLRTIRRWKDALQVHVRLPRHAPTQVLRAYRMLGEHSTGQKVASESEQSNTQVIGGADEPETKRVVMRA